MIFRHCIPVTVSFLLLTLATLLLVSILVLIHDYTIRILAAYGLVLVHINLVILDTYFFAIKTQLIYVDTM